LNLLERNSKNYLYLTYDKVIVVTNDDRRLLLGSIDPTKIVVILNGVEEIPMECYRQIHGNYPSIAYVGH